MPKLIPAPTRIAAAGTKPKIIEEFIGRVNSSEDRVSIAHMRSPGGWVEPGQTPEFDEYTVVLRGQLRVTHRSGAINVERGAGDHRPRRRVGPGTAAPRPKGPSTSRFACPPSHRKPSTATPN